MEEDIYKQRIKKWESLKEGQAMPSWVDFSIRRPIPEVKDGYKDGKVIFVSGRLVAKRFHGKAAFADIQDKKDKIQIYIKSDIIGEDEFIKFKEFDIGDIVAAKGELFKTRTGEVTVKVEKICLLTKCLRPLPEKWHGLKDVELRYRQRYIDLIANPQVKETFIKRTNIIKLMRDLLDKKGFQEVDTPMMHHIPGGASGKPFKTFHNELDAEFYLRIAPELYLKRLIVGGLDRVYELNKSFRNEGVSTKHNPEFTMLEVYQAYANYEDMMNLCEEVFVSIAKELFGSEKFTYQGKEVNLKRPWERRSFAEVIKKRFDINPDDDAEVMVDKLQKSGRAKIKNKLSRSQIVKIIEDLLEEEMSFSPIFFVDYFTFLCPLAKTKSDNPLLSERFELFMGGMEVANAYSELNNPVEQRKRFKQELTEDKERLGSERMVDEDFVEALEYGMPPTGGLGIGIDRLVMLFTDQASIRDVILFPLLRLLKE